MDLNQSTTTSRIGFFMDPNKLTNYNQPYNKTNKMSSTDNATQLNNAKIKKIIKIMNDYEYNLSDGYGYYCGHTVGGEERMLRHVAKGILYINDYETLATKIKQIINVLKNFEDKLSDGYGYYCGHTVGGEEQMLTRIAKDILAVITMVMTACPCCECGLTIMITPSANNA